MAVVEKLLVAWRQSYMKGWKMQFEIKARLTPSQNRNNVVILLEDLR